MKYTFKQVVDDFGPVLAGFQIAVSIVSFFGIGAFASWVIEHWHPFTRWIWTNILSYIQLPDISDPEKDALTAIAFFTPMAISAFLNKVLGDSELYNDEPKLLRVRIIATIIGVVCMYIVGSRVVIDMIELIDSASWFKEDLITYLLAVALSIVIIPILLDNIFSKFRSATIEKKLYLKRRGFYHKIAQIGAISSSILTTLAGSAWVAAEGIGWIRAFSPILVILCIGATVFFHPNRLLNTAGVVVAFVGASLGWELALWVVDVIENAPSQT